MTKLFSRIALSVFAFGLSAMPTFAQNVLVFDTITGSTTVARAGTAGAGRATMGQGFNISPVNGFPESAIPFSRIEFQIRTGGTAINYQQLQTRIQFYDGNTASNTDAFDTPKGPVGGYVFNITPSLLGRTDLNLGANEAYDVGFDLTTPAVLSSAINGVAINLQGNTGSGFANSPDALTAAIRVGAPPAVGFSLFPGDTGGYFRDTTGRNDLNFNEIGDTFAVATPGSNTALYLRLYASQATVVPEAGTVALFVLGAGVPLAGVVLRRRKK